MILIVGCGFLGSYLLKYASEKTNEKILATVRNLNTVKPDNTIEYVKCDVTNKKDLILLSDKCKNEPLTVFYFAACHNVDYVYEYPEEARKINIEALNTFLETIPNIKKFFFASTDCVYGEGKNNKFKFTENSALQPVNEYGRQKAEAEQLVLSKGFTVLRLPFMLGPSLTSKAHFYDKVHLNLLNRETVEMIDGMERSVLSYMQTAQLIYSLSTLGSVPEIINICADEELSKYEIGLIIAKKLTVSTDLVKSISEDQGKRFFKDTRASFTAMDNTLLKDTLGLKSIIWDEKLKTDNK